MGHKKPQLNVLDWLGVRRAPDWQLARVLGPLFAVFIALLICGAYIAAFVLVYGALLGKGAESLSTGALIAALLGAPFVIWATVLKQQTLRYQKEGQITDRITSAVEQLGAEKTVNRIGRPVTIWTGKPSKVSCSREATQKYLDEPRSKLTGSEWSQSYNQETDEVWEGNLYSVAIWPAERTIIQWQGEEILLQESEEIGAIGDWQVFAETAPNIEVRVGAILSLERIAQDSTLHDEGRDHVRVMEILCAYIRENSPVSEAPSFPFPQGRTETTIAEKRSSTPFWITNEFTLRADVQLALSVLGRRTAQQISLERHHMTQDGIGYRVDLSRTNLRYADMQYSNFQNANFFRSHIQGAFCKGANFESANFTYCQLTGVNAASANFLKANLEVADLSFAGLTDADLRDCKISSTHFVRTNLKGARLRFLENVNASEVNRAFIVDSELKEALICGDLLGIVFDMRILKGEFKPRQINGAGLRNCRTGGTRNLFGHILNEPAIPIGWLSDTFGDGSVVTLEGEDRPDHWPSWDLPSDGPHNYDTEWRKWLADPSGYVPPPPPG